MALTEPLDFDEDTRSELEMIAACRLLLSKLASPTKRVEVVEQVTRDGSVWTIVIDAGPDDDDPFMIFDCG